VAKNPAAGPPPKKLITAEPGTKTAKPASTKPVPPTAKPKAKSTVAKKPGKGSVAIDTVPLSEKTAAMKKPGKVAVKTTPGAGKTTIPMTRPVPQTQTASKKPVGKSDQVGIIDTNTKGKPKTPQMTEKKVLTRQRSPQGQVKASGKKEQAGIIFVSRVGSKSSPAGKGSADTIVVRGGNLKGVTSVRIIGKDQHHPPLLPLLPDRLHRVNRIIKRPRSNLQP
jgi:hypothetical protein